MIARDPRLARLEQRSHAVLMLLGIVLVIFLIQLWLITIALEAWLAARTDLAWPTFLSSLACFAINLGLLRSLYGLDPETGGTGS